MCIPAYRKWICTCRCVYIHSDNYKNHNEVKRRDCELLWCSKVYGAQLTKLNEVVQQKRPGLINRKNIDFHYDKARPHTSFLIRQILLELAWDVLPHPPYTPDTAPSNSISFVLLKIVHMAKLLIQLTV